MLAYVMGVSTVGLESLHSNDGDGCCGLGMKDRQGR